MEPLKRYKKLAILDSVTLSSAQFARVKALAEDVVTFKGGVNHKVREEVRSSLTKTQLAATAPNTAPSTSTEDESEIFCGLQMTVPQATQEEMLNMLRGCDGIVTCWTPIPNNVISELTSAGASTRLRHIAAWTNFVEGRVDVDFAARNGVAVTVIPDYGTEAVAQYAMSLIFYQLERLGLLDKEGMAFAKHLDVVRCISEQMAATRSGEWRFEKLKTDALVISPEEIQERTLPDAEFHAAGESLRGKVLGIVGFGRIGKRVKELAERFGMIIKHFSKGGQTDSLENIFATSDFVSLHLPPNGARGLITPELIGMMRPGSMLVNTSVGNVIADEAAMFDIARRLGITLALDVYQKLPVLSQIKKTRRRGEHLIIATYRNGWYTRDALLLKGDKLVQNLEIY